MTYMFENPKNEPVERLQLSIQENGISLIIPALSPTWVEKRYLLHYEKPKIFDSFGERLIGSRERWLEIMSFINDDLQWILTLPFYKFWSNIAFNSEIINCLISVLQSSPTFYTQNKFPEDEEMKNILKKIQLKVLLIFTRIITNKVSSSEYITQDYHSKLVYEKYLITLPTMFALCQLYGWENPKILKKMMKSVMQMNKSYNNDLEYCIQFVFHLLRSIEEKLKNFETIQTHEVKIDYKLEDLIVKLVDSLSNLSIFSLVYPPAVDYLRNDLYLESLMSIYENTIPMMYRFIYSYYYKQDRDSYREFEKYLHVARVELIKIFRVVVSKDVFKDLENDEKIQNVDCFMDRLINLLPNKKFLLDYNLMYPIMDDMRVLDHFSSDKQHFFLHSFFDILDSSQYQIPTNSISQKHEQNIEVRVNQNSDVNQLDAVNSSGVVKSQVELMSLISNVKDIMNHIGEGYIHECLKFYKYDTTAVINALLEKNLPKELKNLDENLPFLPGESSQEKNRVSAPTNNRITYRTRDEFLVEITASKPMPSTHVGKRKDKYKNLNNMLNDKSFKKEVADIYAKYRLVGDDYDDEYDDTYESNDVGFRIADGSLEIDAKQFTTPRVIQAKSGLDEEDNGSSEEENTEENHADNGRDNFLEDPAVLRERREMRMRGRGKGGDGRRKSDVIGNAKGQGNSNEVAANRNKKNINRTSRGNHNRKSGAEWKRRRGMLPS